MLATDMALEDKAVKMLMRQQSSAYRKGIKSRKISLKELLFDEEKHIHFFENIKNHVEKLGETYPCYPHRQIRLREY